MKSISFLTSYNLLATVSLFLQNFVCFKLENHNFVEILSSFSSVREAQVLMTVSNFGVCFRGIISCNWVLLSNVGASFSRRGGSVWGSG